MLEQTLELLQHPQLNLGNAGASSVIKQIGDALRASPIPKPQDHKGGAGVDMFELKLEAVQVHLVLDLIGQALESGVTTSGTARRGLGGFAEAWQEYLGSLSSPS